LEKQQQNIDYGEDDDDDDNENEENESKDDIMNGTIDNNEMSKLMQIKSAEEYLTESRMSKRERKKFTLNKLNEFKDILDKKEGTNDNVSAKKKKGRMDNATGIQFDTDSEQDEDDYDPDWFKSKLNFKKRPQDVEIYTVDDYETIYGNAVQDRKSRSRNDKNDRYNKQDKKHSSRRNDDKYRERKRRDHSDRRRR